MLSRTCWARLGAAGPEGGTDDGGGEPGAVGVADREAEAEEAPAVELGDDDVAPGDGEPPLTSRGATTSTAKARSTTPAARAILNFRFPCATILSHARPGSCAGTRLAASAQRLLRALISRSASRLSCFSRSAWRLS